MIVTGTAPVRIESVGGIALSNLHSNNPVVNPVVGTQVQPQSNVTPVIPRVVTTPPVTPVDNTPAVNVQSAPVIVSQPVAVMAPAQIRLTPSINIAPDRNYRLQVGSFRVARNAVEAFDRLKSAGLTPAYERYTDSSNIDYYRVVLAGIRGADMQSTSEKLSAAGFREAVIREEN
jgi:rare lipoprotein A